MAAARNMGPRWARQDTQCLDRTAPDVMQEPDSVLQCQAVDPLQRIMTPTQALAAALHAANRPAQAEVPYARGDKNTRELSGE
jgi:hypothetical protein